jgi:hypothetical protein
MPIDDRVKARTTFRWLRGPWPIALILFIASLALFTRDNRFSFDYHPDEDGKTHQVIERERNFHHPLLLLNATDLAVHLAGTPKTNQRVVIAGRWVSAAFAAGAVAALAMVAFYRAGGLAAWAVGLLVATHDKLYEAAHYLKEDTALLFGLAFFFLAAERFVRQPTMRTLRLLGITAAVAASGKYIGVVTLLFALPIIARARLIEGRWKHFLLAFGVAFLILNVPPTTHPSSPFRSLKREMVGVTGGHRGLTQDVPHAKYLFELREDLSAPVLALASVWLLALFATARKRTAAEWMLAAFPLVFITLLSFSPKAGGRYLLPVTTLLCVLAGLGVVELARLLPQSAPRFWPNVVITAGTASLLFAQWPLLRTTMDDFRHDDRVELAAWVRANVPLDAIIVEDHRVNLAASAPGDESGKPQIPQHVLDNDYAADLGTLDEMKEWGMVYVAVSKRAYERYFSKNLKPRDFEKADYDRRKEFYARLFAEGELVWERESRGIVYLQPGLRLYRLDRAR